MTAHHHTHLHFWNREDPGTQNTSLASCTPLISLLSPTLADCFAQTQSSSPYALIELEIPDRTREQLPEPPAMPGETLWGINHAAAMDIFPQYGLQLYISPWSAMNQGDSVRVMLDRTSVVSTEIIRDGQANQRVTTFLPAARLTPGRHTLHYIVNRFGQTDDPSAETNILVKLDRPGGRDQDGDTPGHSELHFDLPQAIIDDGVDADAAAAGVLVKIRAYPNISARDNIKFSWGGVFVDHFVTEDEANAAQEAGRNQQDFSIDILIDKETIEKAADSGANGLGVTYEVFDIVQNRSEDWAAEKRIVVDTGNSRLPGPIVDEAVDNILDLDVLKDAPVTVQIWAAARSTTVDELKNTLGKQKLKLSQAAMGKETLESLLGSLKADFTKGDRIAVTLTGTTAAGETVLFNAPVETIENVPHVYEISVPNHYVRQLAQAQAKFSYRLIHADATETTSRGAFINVIGEAARLAAPVALDAVQGAISPDLPSTDIEIPWDDSMEAGDLILPKWIGTRPDFSIYDPYLEPHPISGGEADRREPININVPGTHLKVIEGGTLELYYILDNSVGGRRESTRVTGLSIGEPRAELDPPTVSGIVEGVMDPGLARATLTVPNYGGKKVGDKVYYDWDGSNEGGDATDWLPVTTATLNVPLTFSIPNSAIAPNNLGTVTASYHVVRIENGQTSQSQSLTFNVGQTVALPAPAISSIRDSKNTDIPPGESTSDTTVSVTGTAPATYEVEIFDATTPKGKVKADVAGMWSMTLAGLAPTAHPIKAVAQYGEKLESAVWNFTVVTAAEVRITLVKDSQGNPIPNGGTTTDKQVTLSGIVSYTA